VASSQYLSTGLNFGTHALGARLLGPEDYGLAVLIMSYPALVVSLLTVDSGKITARYVARLRGDVMQGRILEVCKLGYVVDFIVTISGTIVVLATAGFMARLYGAAHLSWLMGVYAASYLVASPGPTSQAIFIGLERFELVALTQVLDRGTRFVLVALLLSQGLGVAGMVLGISIGQFTGLLMMLFANRVLLRRGTGSWWKASLRASGSLRREATRLFGWNYVASTLSGLLAQGPLLLLGVGRGPQQAGLFRACTTLAGVVGPLEGAPGTVAYPRLSSLLASNTSGAVRRILREWTLYKGLPLAAFILLVGAVALPVGVPLLFGTGYSEAIRGGQILIIGVAIGAATFWVRPLYYAAGKINYWAKGSSVQALVILLFSWPVVQKSGFLGLVSLITLGKVSFVLSMVRLATRDDQYKGLLRGNGA
jgi:O-antigen/teichoic acid export membrane protein